MSSTMLQTKVGNWKPVADLVMPYALGRVYQREDERTAVTAAAAARLLLSGLFLF